MKDHEVRELVDALTMTAFVYAGTQQLRERVAHLVGPAVDRMRTESQQLHDRIETLEALLRELQTARPLLLYGDSWIQRIEEALQR